MSSKRKAAEVERLDGKRPHPPLHQHRQSEKEDEDEQRPQHSKKHVPHTPLLLQHSSSNSLLAAAQHRNGDVSASPPSSPHTAPLPAELHTPPAIDDGLLASLTLSPLSSSSATRRVAAAASKPAANLPSSPLTVRATAGNSEAAGSGIAKRSRVEPVLSSVPSLRSQPLPATPDNAVRDDSEFPASLASAPAASFPPITASTSPVSVAEAVSSGTPSTSVTAPRPATSSSSDSLSSQAVSVDSAIRGMQTISLSSLSFGTAASVTPTGTSSASASASVPSPPAAVSSSSLSTATPASVSLPLIRLTLNSSRVRRTSSNEAAQGNLKKHKRSLFSPTPNQIAPASSRASAGSTDSQDKEREKDEDGLRKEAKVAAIVPADEQPLTLIVRAASPATDAGSERAGSERDEDTSVASLETAVSITSFSIRSPTSCASSSPSPSPSPSTFPASSSPIRCEVCNKDLSSAAQLEDHRQGRRHQHMLLMRQSGGGFACELCGKVFTCAADQDKHQLSERHKEMVEAAGREAADGKSGVFALACELCGVTFTGFTQQRQHMEGKRHIAMARQHEREQKAETTDDADEIKEGEQQSEDTKGRVVAERDGDGTLSKKRKYGRASPAVTSQSQQQQQQPSPTPRHILPGNTSTPSTAASPSSSSSSLSSLSSPGGSSAKRAQQTIRYITPPPPPSSQPHVLPPFRISLPSSRSVGTASSVGSAGESGESDGQDRPGSASRVDKRLHSMHWQRYQHPPPHQYLPRQQQQQQQQQTWENTAEVDDDTSSASSYSIDSSHELAQRSPYGYTSDASYPHTSFSSSPPFPPQNYPPYPPYPSPLPVHPSASYGSSVVLPPASFPSLLPPMYGFLSPSAAASLSGPVLPSHTPVTIMYPTELLLAQQYAHSHPYASYPPLYLLPTPPPAMGMTMHGAEASVLPVTVQQQDDGQLVDESHMGMQQPTNIQQQQQLLVIDKLTASEQRDEQTAAVDLHSQLGPAASV